MDRKRLIKHLVFLMFFIFIVDFLAQQFYWYYSIVWLDILMHFLGGIWLGLFFFYILSKNNQVFPSVLKVMLGVLVIGILWEIFQFFTQNYIGQEAFSLLDTLLDIFFDLLGGLCVILYLWKKQPR